MALGLSPAEGTGVIDPVDVGGLGAMEWESVTGVPANSPLVSAGPAGYNVEQEPWGRVVTTPTAQSGPASDVMATPEGQSTTMLVHWRDLFNFHGSVVPWLLFGLIAIVFFGHLRLRAAGAAGGFGRNLKAGASLS